MSDLYMIRIVPCIKFIYMTFSSVFRSFEMRYKWQYFLQRIKPKHFMLTFEQQKFQQVQSNLCHPATLGPAPIQISDLAG